MSSISKQLPSTSYTGKTMPSSSTDVRLVLMGKTGNGKSSTANSILGRKVFESKVGSSSVTQRCRRACGDVLGRHVTVLDTPGLMDTHQTPQEVQKELKRSVTLLLPGPHAFLLVFQIGRFTQEEKEAVRQIKQAMGSQVLGFSIVVFTHGDILEEGTSAMHCLVEGCEGLAELIAWCGGRYCIFNNHNSKTKEQVSELLGMVDSILDANKGNCYTRKMLQRAEEEMAGELKEERKLLKEKAALVEKKQEAAIRQWYQRELDMIQLKNQREIKELRKKLMQSGKGEKLAREREEAHRIEMEGNEKKEKERESQEMVRVMEMRREEEHKRDALQEKLDKVTKTLEEQTVREANMRQEMKEKIQNSRVENGNKKRERQLHQTQREHAIRRLEETKRDALQKKLYKLTQSLEGHRRREEEREQRELPGNKREENEREQDRETERSEALQQKSGIAVDMEEQNAREATFKRQLDESLRREKERCEVEIQKCSALCNEVILKRSAGEHGTIARFIRPVMGYAQEMGLVGLNIALESIAALCNIQ